MAASTTAHAFILPDLGEGLTEAEIVNWLVAVGDTVAIDQPVVEVESAKSTVELPCPFAGVVEELHFAAGATVHAGQALLTIGGGANAGGSDVVPGTALRSAAAESNADSGSGAVLIGYGTKERVRTERAVPTGRFGRKATAAAVAPVASVTIGSDGKPSPVVSPLVRRLAREHGFEAHTLAGSGPEGLVMRADVERRIASGASASEPTRGAVPPAAPVPHAEGDVRIPLTGLRKVVAERMSASRRDVPEATIWLDVDATELIAAKEQLQRSTGERWSLNALIARFAVAGLKRHPILNSSVDVAAGEIVQHSQINLGIAAQTARGLMVPVVHDAGSMTTGGLRDAIAGIVETSKTGAFAPEQLRGGTFTLNNYGGFGVDGSAPIINQPEVAMLGVGRIIDRPWVVDGQIVVRKVVVLSMVFDHRVCDGDVPSEFIGFIARCVENPIAVLGEL
ncbi:MAG: 2-oxo acid dehydrogenase subunit E2 [Cryobacterium sp.]|nr:2-oxo acid dehydrogenase subunit E2 [Cryobacterium sp.]